MDILIELIVMHIEAWTKWLAYISLIAFLHFHKLNDNAFIQIMLSIVPVGVIDNKSALVQKITWWQIGNKPLP